jgi:hypothetical protein
MAEETTIRYQNSQKTWREFEMLYFHIPVVVSFIHKRKRERERIALLLDFVRFKKNMVSNPPVRCWYTPVKCRHHNSQLEHHHKNNNHHHHHDPSRDRHSLYNQTTVTIRRKVEDSTSLEPPSAKKFRYHRCCSSISNNNIIQKERDRDVHPIKTRETHPVMNTCNSTTGTITTTTTTILYYSRYTTARLRASTPNQRSPLYARQLRF